MACGRAVVGLGSSGGCACASVEKPTYEWVCSDASGHAEVVRVEFGPSKISYEKLLEVFWGSHDPTQLNRQGPDVGTQYRSVVFTYNDEQQATAERSKASLAETERFPRPIVTEIERASAFFPAEEYHQKYLEKRGMGACSTGQ